MIQVFSSDISLRNKPRNLSEKDKPLFEHEFTKEIRESHVITLYRATILKDIIITKPFALKKYISYTHIGELGAVSLFKRLLLSVRTSSKIEKAVWIIDSWSSGYFHWLTDALPRMMLSEHADKNSPVLLPSYFKKESFITESLNILKREVIYFDPMQKLSVNELVLTSHTANTGNYNKLLISELRKRFQTSGAVLAKRKVYMSRGKAVKRKVVNEAEVQQLLISHGFEVHYFEEYDFRKQVKIMNETSYLIGLHGGGLTNMLFMPTGGTVVELRNTEDNHNNCFFSLASDLDLGYCYLLNEGDKLDTHSVNVQVNLEALKEVLNFID